MVKSKSKIAFSLALICVISLVIANYFGYLNSQTHNSTVTELKDFNFTDHTGKNFTKANLQGRWTLIFFGFTNCGMVCPTTMAALNTMYQSLQKELSPAEMPQVVFISVDPERDTQTRLNEYIHAYNPNFVGARAEHAETEKLMQQMHIISAKLQAQSSYTLDHTADIFIFNPKAQLQASLLYPHQAEQLIKDYKRIAVPVKNDPEFRDTQDHRVQLSKLHGSWVVVNYWATWCHSCLEEIPELNQFYKHNKNVQLLGVNFDKLPATETKLAAKKLGILFPVMTNDPNEAWQLGEIVVLPVTFIIAPNGKVVKTLLGANTEKSLSATLDNLQKTYA